MDTDNSIIDIRELHRRFGKLDAVNGLSLRARPGGCYGLFGRNGTGKTTTIKCLLNLLRPTAGTVRVFGLDPQKEEVAVKSRLAYVPDAVAFYPWMTVRETLNYLASFRQHWNDAVELDLLRRFELDPGQKTANLSKGQKTQLALIGAVAPGAGASGSGRTDLRPGPDRPPRIHRDGHWRLSIGRPGTAHRFCLDAFDFGIRGAD